MSLDDFGRLFVQRTLTIDPKDRRKLRVALVTLAMYYGAAVRDAVLIAYNDKHKIDLKFRW